MKRYRNKATQPADSSAPWIVPFSVFEFAPPTLFVHEHVKFHIAKLISFPSLSFPKTTNLGPSMGRATVW